MNSKQVSETKYLTLITTIIITLYLITAIVQNRIVSLGHYNVCAAIFVYPFSYVLSDITTEVYGYRKTRQIIWCALLSWAISGAFITAIISMPSPGFASHYSIEFNDVMGPYVRTIAAGIFAVIAGQFLNIYIISKLKILTQGRFFWLRSVSSCFLGDAITTILAITLIFLGRAPLAEITQIVVLEIGLSIILQALFAIPATYMVSFLKRAEKLDTYDYNINFNPFKLTND